MRKYFLAILTSTTMLVLPLLQVRAVSLEEVQSQLQVLTLRVHELAQSQQNVLDPELQSAGITKNLYFGITNDNDVRLLQQYLAKAGYFFGPVTGNFSTITLKAVKQFQAANGIVPTGYVGALTRASLKGVMASAQPPLSIAAQSTVEPAIELTAPAVVLQKPLPFVLNTDNHPTYTYSGGGSGAIVPPSSQPETSASSSDSEDDSGGSGGTGGGNDPGDNSGSVSTSTPDQSGTGSTGTSTPDQSGSTGTSTPDQSGSGSTGTSTPDQSGSGNGTSTPDQSGSGSTGTSTPDQSGSTGTSTPPSDPTPNGNNPHEPAGFTLVTNRAFNSISTSSSDASGTEGWDPEEGLWNHISIIQDSSAPASAPNVLAAFYPAGTVGGTTNATPARMLKLFSPAQSVYVSIWVKLSSNFQGNGTATNKAFYVWLDGQPSFFMSSEGIGNGTLIPTGRLQDTPDDRTVLPANLASSTPITRGQWQHWEVLLKANTPGVANGEFNLWVDGTKVSQYNDIMYLDASQTRPFMSMDLEPIWGGAGDTVTADQYQYFDNVYVSTSN